MLQRLSARIMEGITLGRSWMSRQQVVPFSSGTCCFSISSTEILIAYAHRQGHKVSLESCEKFLLPSDGNIQPILSAYVKRNAIQNMKCIWVMDPKDYQLFLMETLPVEANEFQAAIRWKLKGMLSFPVETAVIDQFDMPIQKGTNAQKMMTVIVAKQAYLQRVFSQVKESELQLKVIDVTELSLRNLNACFEKDGKNTALLYLQENFGQLIITRQSDLYMSRRIDFDLALIKSQSINSTQYLEKLALEIQRSFDYFQAQWRSQIPERIFLVSPKIEAPDIAHALSEFLGAQVMKFELPDVIINKANIVLEQKYQFLPLLGGLLREEIEHAARS